MSVVACVTVGGRPALLSHETVFFTQNALLFDDTALPGDQRLLPARQRTVAPRHRLPLSHQLNFLNRDELLQASQFSIGRRPAPGETQTAPRRRRLFRRVDRSGRSGGGAATSGKQNAGVFQFVDHRREEPAIQRPLLLRVAVNERGIADDIDDARHPAAAVMDRAARRG